MLDVGKYIWIKDEVLSFVPGKITSVDDNYYQILIEINGQEEVRTVDSSKEYIEVDQNCLEGVDDLLALGDFDQQTLLHNTRTRYSEDKIYSFIGMPILIAVNPYKKLSIYEMKVIKSYKDYFEKLKTDPSSAGPPKPHLYHLAEAAYRDMLNDKKNQSLIISGESGSGKTESTKIILRYLATSSLSLSNPSELNNPNNQNQNQNKVTVEDQVLESNPLLEAFGNAKTVKNNNSSRFGKFIQVSFTDQGKILSAKIFNYLLEKSRVVKLGKGERNYHIFYQILKGANEEERAKYKIENIENYYLLSNDTYDNDDMDDAVEFQSTKRCMKKLKFTDEEIENVFYIVMSILNLGNINFDEYEENCKKTKISEESVDYWENAAYFLGIEKEELADILTTQNFLDPSSKKIMKRFKDEPAAFNSLNALAKALYSRMFNFIVIKINEAIRNNNPNKNYDEKKTIKIGILDIFGFENFEHNSFEQLCINYANERLQQFFNNHIFKLEQEEYKKEGIDWTQVSFVDNKEIIDLIDNGKLSIFGLLDEEGNLKGNDKKFRNKVYDNLKKKFDRLINKNDGNLIIEHYAGQILYNVENFVEKNLDELTPNISEALSKSKNQLVKMLFDGSLNLMSNSNTNSNQSNTQKKKTEGIKPGKLHQDSVSKQFKQQLDDLLIMLNQSNPRYVKCIKPNSEKKPGILESNDVLEQLKSAGVLEAIKIRKQGYSIRRTKEEFYNFYNVLTPEIDLKSNCNDISDAINKMMKILLNIPEMIQIMKGKKKMIQVGHSKVFMKEDIKTILDYKRNRIKYIYLLQGYHRAEKVRKKIEVYLNKVKKIQATYRMHLFKMFINSFRSSCKVLQKKFRIIIIKNKANKLISEINKRKQERFEKERQRQIKELEEKTRLADLKRLEELKKAQLEGNNTGNNLDTNPFTMTNNDVDKINTDINNDNDYNDRYYSRDNNDDLLLYTQENNQRKARLNNNINQENYMNSNNTNTIFSSTVPHEKKKKKKKKSKATNKDSNLIPNDIDIDTHLKSKLLELSNELESTKSERDNLKIQLQQKNEEIAKLKGLNPGQINLDNLDNSSSSEVIKNLKKELEDKDTNYYILNMQLEDLKKQKSNLDEVTESLKAQHQKRIEKYDQEINDLHSQINDLQKSKHEFEQKYIVSSANNEKYASNDIEINDLRNENKNLQKKLDDTKHKLNKEINELKAKINLNSENLVDIDTFNSIKDENDSLKSKNNELMNKISALETNTSLKNEYENKLQDALIKMKEVTNMNDEASLKLSKYEKIEKVLKEQLANKEKEIEMFKKFNEDTRKENEKITDENMALKKENYTMRSKIDLLDSKSKNDSEFSKLKTEVENYKKQINDYESSTEKLKKSLKNKKDNLDSKKSMNLLLVELVKLQKDEIKLTDAFNLTHSEKIKENLKHIKEENAKVIVKLNEVAKKDNDNSDDSGEEDEEEEEGEGEEEEGDEGEEEEDEEEEEEEDEGKNESKKPEVKEDGIKNTNEGIKENNVVKKEQEGNQVENANANEEEEEGESEEEEGEDEDE